jgi:hypothetical protein
MISVADDGRNERSNLIRLHAEWQVGVEMNDALFVSETKTYIAKSHTSC